MPIPFRASVTVDEASQEPENGRRTGQPSPVPSGRVNRLEELFARRTNGIHSNAMRELMAITARPDIISLAGGLPDTSLFPAEDLAAIMARVAADSSARALQYGPTEGLDEVKRCIQTVMAAEAMDVALDEIMVTTGGQQAIDLVCRALLDPGDVVLAEGPTYPGAVPVFTSYEAEVVQIGMDEEGMDLDELQRVLERLRAEGRRPKFLYSVPSFQNPGGVSMSDERRRRLVVLARCHGLLILEDNPYGLLRYEGEPLQTLKSLDDRNVIYAGTFSKILSPGLRLGWLSASPLILDKCNLGKQSADLCSSPFSQFFVAEFFASRDWRAFVDELKDLYHHRRDVMLEALHDQFPTGAHWTVPAGGLFIWVRLPEPIDTTDLLARALREHVAFVPGRAAYLDGRGGSEMRLNFSGVSDDIIREGIKRIGAAIREQLVSADAMLQAPSVVRFAVPSRDRERRSAAGPTSLGPGPSS